MTVFLLAFLAMSQSIGRSMNLTEVNQETALATDGLREMLEILEGAEDFSTVFARYNADPGDDPPPPLESPGDSFAIAGLAPVAGDPDGFVGEIVFPSIAGVGGGLELREDLWDEALGMPRDLDGDGEIDDENHAADYRLLPVLIRARWDGPSGERSTEIRTLIADR